MGKSSNTSLRASQEKEEKMVEQLARNRLIIIKQSHEELIETKLISMGSIVDYINGSIPSRIREINLILDEMETGKRIVDRLAVSCLIYCSTMS
jgi:two-component sensor histidine kinase